MIQQDLEQLSVTRRDLRKFGLLVGAVFLLLGGWFLFRHKAAWPYFITPGGLLVLFGALAPQLLKQVYRGWMALAMVLGLCVSTIILTLFYFVVVTPIGLLARLFGKDFLSLKLDRQTQSYWLLRERSAARPVEQYEQQF